MPDTHTPDGSNESKPQTAGSTRIRGRGRGRGALTRGRGRGGALATPSGRLGSLRTGISAVSTTSTFSPSSSHLPSSSSTTTATAATGSNNNNPPKMKFTPTIPARRHKKEPSSLLASSSMPKKEESGRFKSERGGRGRGGRGGRGRGKGRFDLIQSVSGPFAQGPASIGGPRRTTGGIFTGPASLDLSAPGSSASGKDASNNNDEEGKIDPNDPNAPVLLLTDHNEEVRGDEFDVQTEEMAIKAAEEMNRMRLDNSVSEIFLEPPSSDNDIKHNIQVTKQEKILVFQFPEVPKFELSSEVVERLAKEREERRAAQKAANDTASHEVTKEEQKTGTEDVKPFIPELHGESPFSEDVKPNISAMDVDSDEKPKIKDATEVDDADEDDDEDVLDGYVGKLVVFKSGAVKLQLGDGILLDVSQGADCQFLRGLLALDTREPKSAFMLGNIDSQLVCTPDLDNLLS